MALPDYLRWEPGTAIVWGESGASGVTKTLSFEGLANNAARQGDSADLGAQFEQAYMLLLVVETGTAPTAGNTVEAYLANTYSTSYWPAGVSGSDGSYKSGEEQEWLNQLGSGPDTILVATNDGNTVQVAQSVLWLPRGRYVAPIIYNKLGQAVRDEATATNNDSRLILVPLSAIQQDT